MKKIYSFGALLLSLIIVMILTVIIVGKSKAEDYTYHSYDSLVSDLTSLALNNPDIATLKQIGTTEEGRMILAIKISDNASSNLDEAENRILIVGNHHAREWISLEVPYLIALHLISNYSDNHIKNLIDNQEIWIVPLLNPDGYEYSRNILHRLWRKNRNDYEDGCSGVDLNRNYGSSTWGSINDIYTSKLCVIDGKEQETYIGPSGFSEAETNAINHLLSERQFDAVLSYHSYSQLILWPWGYTEVPIKDVSDRTFMVTMGSEMRDLIYSIHDSIYTPEQSSKLYITSGDLTDWAYEKFKIPSITVELRPLLFIPGFLLPDDQIGATYEENLPAALNLLDAFLPSISKPTTINPINAGSTDNPNKIFVEITGIGKNKVRSDFSVKVGGIDGTVVSAVRIGVNTYKLAVVPPVQSSTGPFDIKVSIGDSSASQEDAIYYYGEAQNVDVVLVIDNSGSMSSYGYIQPAKDAAKQFVDFMQDGDKVAVVKFNTSASVVYPLTTIVSGVTDTRDLVKAAIDSISTTGMTSIGAGLVTAQNQLTLYGEISHPWSIVLLSDGYENTSPYVSQVLPAILETKTVIHTVALGPNSDQALLLDIASQTGGTYTYAPDAESLINIYNTIARRVSDQQTLFLESGVIALGEIDEKEILLEPGIDNATFALTWSDPTSLVSLTLLDPQGNLIDSSTPQWNPLIRFYSGDTYQYFHIDNPEAGLWKMIITREDGSLRVQEVTTDISYTTSVTVNTDTTLEFYLDSDDYLPNDRILMTATVSDDQPIIGAEMSVSVEIPITQLSVSENTIQRPLTGELIAESSYIQNNSISSIQPITLYDDGYHFDGSENDGIYANEFYDTSQAGVYIFDLSVNGTTNDGSQFWRLESRTASVSLPVLPAVLVTSSPPIEVQAGDVMTSTFTVKNNSSLQDTYELRVGEIETSLEWGDLSAIPETVTLNAGQTVTYNVLITVPGDAPSGSVYSLPMVAVSLTDISISDVAKLVVSIPTYQTFLPSVAMEYRETPEEECEGYPIANPGFEQDCGWDFFGGPAPAWYAEDYYYEGERSLGVGLLADDLTESYSEVSQTWIVPDDANLLELWILGASPEQVSAPGVLPDIPLSIAPLDNWVTVLPGTLPLSPVTDTSYIYLIREDGWVIRRLLWEETIPAGWTQMSWDITDLRGQTVRLLIGQYNNGDNSPSRIYIDDITLTY